MEWYFNILIGIVIGYTIACLAVAVEDYTKTKMRKKTNLSCPECGGKNVIEMRKENFFLGPLPILKCMDCGWWDYSY